MSFTLITPPAVEPVTLTELKAHARIDTSADDALAAMLITAARLWAESYTRRAFMTQTWRLSLDAWPESSVVELPRPPLTNVDEITTYDDNDAGTIWGAENYYVDTGNEPGRLALRAGRTWPVPTRAVKGISIDFTAGYGTTASDVPEAIKLAIKQLAAHWYEHRGEAVVMGSSRHDAVANQTGVNMPLVIQALLDPYTIRSVRL